VIHFDGSLSLEFCSYCGGGSSTELARDKRPSEVGASIGTPGLGKGSFAYWLPEPDDKSKVLAEVEFICPDAAVKPSPVKLSLTRADPACCSFTGSVQVPKEATKAKVTLTAPDWKGDKLPAVTREFPVVEPKSRR